jgi:hypothetical protein
MVSFAVRRTLGTITASIVVLAVVVAPNATFAQPDSSPAAEDAVQEIVDEIAEIESLQGANSPDLIEPLTTLSSFYEERGDSDLALALIARARDVIEVNHGLHTLEEAWLMRRSIRIERARGNAETAWNEEKQLLALIRRHPNDARTVPFLFEISNGRKAILARYRAGEFPPEIILGCYYGEWEGDSLDGWRRTSCYSGSKRTVVRALRIEADAFYLEAGEIAVRLARWVESPCARPEASAIAGERRSTRRAQEEMQADLRTLSDYAACTQVKYEHAASTNASPEELSQLGSDRNGAAEELAARTGIYEEWFGPIRTADHCLQKILPSYARTIPIEDLACVHTQ